MKIIEKLYYERAGLEEHGPINIVVFGDSVTHGAVGPCEIDYDTVYWNRLRKMINKIRDYVPVNVINSGIGGTCAEQSVKRIDRDVLSHNPDLVIVCFGLNDVNGPLEKFLGALREIFRRLEGVDTIFMTPNMLNTYVAEDTREQLKEYAAKTAEMQNGGRMDEYMSAAVALAREMGVYVCDCYAKWREMSKTEDVTMLLANRINHPTREMHALFADSLYDVIFADGTARPNVESSSTMYNGK